MSRSSYRKHGGKRKWWSQNPDNGTTDWTIHVRQERSRRRDTYYMHSSILVKLPAYRVPYFENIFKDRMQKIGRHESEIIISDDLARKFRILLDFLYCSGVDDEEEFLSEVSNGLSLYSLAEYYDVQPLIEMLSVFYRDAQNAVSDPVEFLNESKSFESTDLFESAIDHFARHMHSIEFVEEGQLEPKNLIQALKRRREMKIKNSPSDSENISCLVALCSKHYTKDLTQRLFSKMTRDVFIPYIDQEAALQLLIAGTELEYWKENEKMSSLQSRCMRSLLSDWDGVRKKFDTDEDYLDALRRLPPDILSLLLLRSTESAEAPECRDEPSTVLMKY